MTTIFDLFEVTDISSHTTYSVASGNLLGVVDGASSSALDDGEFDEGDSLTIGGVNYTITVIQEPRSSGRFTLGDGTERSFDPGRESDLSAVFLTVSNGAEERYFIIPNDSYGDMDVQEIRTGEIGNVAGSDAATISTVDNDVNVVCFVAGSLIETPGAAAPIENLRRGDLVLTRDNGAQPIRLILTRRLDFAAVSDRLKPVLLARDSLGPGRPDRPLLVSPQHRIVVSDRAGQQVLVLAKALTGRRGIRVARGMRRVTYFHLVFSRHEIIRANGVLTESLFPGPMALRALPPAARRELVAVFDPAQRAGGKVAARPAGPLVPAGKARRDADLYR